MGEKLSNELTDKEREMYEYIVKYMEENLISPSFQEICCSCSKFLSQILKIVVKNFSEIVPGKQTQKEGFRPLIF